METFNNIWIYTLDPENELPVMRPLPSAWVDPVSGVTHTSMHLYTEAELNDLHWYKIMEEHDVVLPTVYQIESISTFVWREISKSFLATFVVVYKPIEVLIAQRLVEIDGEKWEFIESKLNNKPDIEKWVGVYRAIAKLINHTTPLVPAIASDTYLQSVLTQLVNLADDVNVYDDRKVVVENATDEETIINA